MNFYLDKINKLPINDHKGKQKLINVFAQRLGYCFVFLGDMKPKNDEELTDTLIRRNKLYIIYIIQEVSEVREQVADLIKRLEENEVLQHFKHKISQYEADFNLNRNSSVDKIEELLNHLCQDCYETFANNF